MRDDTPGLRHLPTRVIKWLGYDVLQEHPLARMLHDARAASTQRDKKTVKGRPSFQLKPQRIYARGRSADAGEPAEPLPQWVAEAEPPPDQSDFDAILASVEGKKPDARTAGAPTAPAEPALSADPARDAGTAPEDERRG
jgi:hypothetical protein